MKFHRIRDENDYLTVLARIDQLMDAPPGTPEGEELDVWVDLLTCYELTCPEARMDMPPSRQDDEDPRCDADAPEEEAI